MKICNVKEIFDNSEIVTVVLETGSVVHLPRGKHSITIHETNKQKDHLVYDIYVDMFQEYHTEV